VPPSPARDTRAVRGRIQSTPTLQAPPPKGDRRAIASPHSVVANEICSCPPPSPTVTPPPREDRRAVRGRIQSTPTLQAPPPKGDRRE